MPRKASKEQIREKVAASARGADPHITEDNYLQELNQFLNWHNANTDSKNIRKWAIEFASKISKDGKILDKASDFELRSIGMISRAIMRGEFIQQDHVDRVRADVNKLIEKYSSSVKKSKFVAEKKQEPAVTAEDKSAQQYTYVRSEIDGALDDFILTGKEFNLTSVLAGQTIPAAVLRKVAKSLQPTIDELIEARTGDCPQLKEAYSYMGRVKLRKTIEFVESIITACEQGAVSAKTIRKPRAKKVKPPSVVVAKMRYLKEFAELNLISESPTKIIGATEVWVYDTKRRRVSRYSAVSGQKLDVKGTTILNFSVEESGVKTLRKPAEFFSGSMAKRSIVSAFNGLKTKAIVPNGRTNEDTIILKVF